MVVSVDELEQQDLAQDEDDSPLPGYQLTRDLGMRESRYVQTYGCLLDFFIKSINNTLQDHNFNKH